MKNFFYLILGLFIILASIYSFVTNNVTQLAKVNSPSNIEYTERRAVIGETRLVLEMADTLEKRILGLSGRSELEEGRGLFFEFEKVDFHGIWMKDMHFAIDIVWLDENFMVVSIEREVGPETFPDVFYPNRAAKFVLELPAGFTKNSGIDTGMMMSFEDENGELSPVEFE